MLFFVFALLAIAAVSGTEDKKLCEAGATTKVDCNTCICSKDGTSQACTLMSCLPTEHLSESRVRRQVADEGAKVDASEVEPVHEKVCVPGVSTKMDCNTCICSKDGMYQACTLMLCLPQNLLNVTAIHIESTESVAQADKANLDGSKQVPDRFTTVSSLRRKRQVGHNNPTGPCEAGKKFKIDCNDCTCGSDGMTVACTRKQCPVEEKKGQ